MKQAAPHEERPGPEHGGDMFLRNFGDFYLLYYRSEISSFAVVRTSTPTKYTVIY
jgi:hypothetical protein